MAQAKDGRHLTQLGNAEIRAAKKLRKLTRKDGQPCSESYNLNEKEQCSILTQLVTIASIACLRDNIMIEMTRQ
jgi:hypothetical protein